MAGRLPTTAARILPGLAVALLGVLLLAGNLDLYEIGKLRKFWPVVVVAFGLSALSRPSSRGFGAVLTAAGVALQLSSLGWIDLRVRDVWKLWPLILIVVGASLLLTKAERRNPGGAVVLLGLGSYFLASNFGLIRFELWRLWPLAVIAMGINLARKALKAG